jgi:very-short-patch-repair endonuclease
LVVVESGAFLGMVDLAWPEAKSVVVYEGPHHVNAEKAEEDARRYATLRAAGWRVIRLDHAYLRDLDAVIDRIRDALVDRVR